jgi:predicted neutral ceramidase superfamily lipid hydrolase
MKTKYFPLFAIVAAAIACFTDAYLMMFQNGATSQAQVTPRVELLLAMFALGCLLFAAYFFGSFIGENGWTKLKGFSLAGCIITALSFVYYTAFALVYGSTNENLKSLIGSQMSIVSTAFTYFIIIYLVVLYMSNFKNKLLEYAILTTLCISLIFKAVVYNWNVPQPTASINFGYVLLKSNFIPDVILALMFAFMFITMIMPEKIEQPIEELDAEDVIVDDYEVEDDADEIEDNSVEAETEVDTKTESTDETEK